MNNKYENLQEGKIIIVNNFKFEDGSLDHAWNKGRPCLILFVDDDYEYIAPIKSELKKDTHFIDKYYINDENMLYFYNNFYVESTLRPYKYNKRSNKLIRNAKGKKHIEGYINLEAIYKLPVAFRNEICKLDYDAFKSVIEKLHNIHNIKDNNELKEKAIKVK